MVLQISKLSCCLAMALPVPVRDADLRSAESFERRPTREWSARFAFVKWFSPGSENVAWTPQMAPGLQYLPRFCRQSAFERFGKVVEGK
jgi:hypothetical protein